MLNKPRSMLTQAAESGSAAGSSFEPCCSSVIRCFQSRLPEQLTWLQLAPPSCTAARVTASVAQRAGRKPSVERSASTRSFLASGLL